MNIVVRSLLVLTGAAALGCADDPLDGFRKASPLAKYSSTVPGASLLEQARNAVVMPNVDDATKRAILLELLDVSEKLAYFLKYEFGANSLQKFLTALENARTDKQNGSAGANSTGTSIVSKPGATSILSAAVEAGALTQSASNGVQATFQGNIVGITRMLLGEDVYKFCDSTAGSIVKSCDQGVARFLKPLSFSVTLDPNGQKAITVPVMGSATTSQSNSPSTVPSSVILPSSNQRVSAWGVRYALRNPHVLDSQENRTAYFKGVNPTGQKLAEATDKVFGPITRDQSYDRWLNGNTDPKQGPVEDGAIGRLGSQPPNTSQAAFEAAFARELDRLVVVIKAANPQFDTQGPAAWQSFQDYYAARETALDALNNATMLTLEYTHNDPLNQPSLSDLRFILSWQASKTILLTSNFAAEMYNTLPQGAKVSRFRDAQAAAEIDVSLPQWGKLGTPLLSAAGYYQYQQDPALINITNANLAPGTNIQLPNGAATVLGQKGSIGIAQFKLTIPFKSTGVSFPIGITWSNRTELIKASDVSGHVGISFDLDNLFAQKNGQKGQ